MYKIILIIFILYSCESYNSSRVYVTGKGILPENETTSEQTEYYLFIKRVNGTNFSIGSKQQVILVTKESYYKLKVGDTLKNKH